MTQEEEVLKQITDYIYALDENKRLRIDNCIEEMRLLIEKYQEVGILALSFIGAELATKE